MTPAELEAIKKRDQERIPAAYSIDDARWVECICRDRRALLAWAAELAAEREAFRLETVEQRRQILGLRAVVAAAERVAADRKLTLGMTHDEVDLCDALSALAKSEGGE